LRHVASRETTSQGFSGTTARHLSRAERVVFPSRRLAFFLTISCISDRNMHGYSFFLFLVVYVQRRDRQTAGMDFDSRHGKGRPIKTSNATPMDETCYGNSLFSWLRHDKLNERKGTCVRCHKAYVYVFFYMCLRERELERER
jgi:hypothetical protein